MKTNPTPPSGNPRRGHITVQRLADAPEVSSLQIRRAVRAASGESPLRAVTVALVDDARIAALHVQFMGLAGPTDVLTFDLRDDESQPEIEGEIVISVDTARRQARRFKVTATEELLRYAIHGVLHLRGYDDDTPARRRRMRREENRVLAILDQAETAAARKTAGRAGHREVGPP